MDKIEASVRVLLDFSNGHGFDHVDRVRKLALKFAEKERANKHIVELAALLHDVDDYKLFGEENAKNLTNANQILDDNNIDEETKGQVLDIIKTMGYNKYLEGIRPTTLEGKIVSDADMCDAIGSLGILRTHAYNLSKGGVFFDKTLAPKHGEKNSSQYKTSKAEHAAQHFFDKLLILPSILMTSSGQEEGSRRLRSMVDFLRELFREEDAIDWAEYLNIFLKQTPYLNSHT